MPNANNVPLTGLSSLSEQLDGTKTPAAQRLLKHYGQIVLTRLWDQQQDFRRLSLYDDHLRRAGDKELGLDVGDTPEEEELRIDSPNTTHIYPKQGLSPLAASALTGLALIGGAGLATGAWALLNRPTTPVVKPVEPTMPTPVNPGDNFRVGIQ